MIALLVAVQDYRTVVHYLWSADFAAVAGTRRSVRRTPVVWAAGLLVVIGLLTFGAMLLRLP